MTLEIILFIDSILFGMILYWRESKTNKIYRFFNKLFYSKDLQMKATSKKGFVFQQSFVLRLVYIAALYLITIVILRFVIPIDIATISLFTSGIFGTLVGTYLAGFVFKSSEVIDEQSDSIMDAVSDTIQKGKAFVNDLDSDDSEAIETPKPEAKKEEKSARERLKDKGLM